MSDIKKQYLDLKLCEEQWKIRKEFNSVDKAKKLCRFLDSHGISYETVIKHKEVLGCEESELYYQRFNDYLGEGYSICKNLLLKERKGEKRYFLVITDSRKKIDLSLLKEKLDCKKLEFVQAKEMKELIHTEPGNVSLFNMIYDKDKKINLVIDEELLTNELLAFHPLYNGMSMFISPSECLKFLKQIERSVDVVKISEKEHNKVLEKKIS